ncbi:PAS domain S-box protein [Clostridiales bacterium oral taxon 876 str. F0540]|nr:PAS domain S-box protein [Clostridiales bacterium oral taxon 876 str. F0540]
MEAKLKPSKLEINKYMILENQLKATKAKLERVNRLYSILSKINHAIIRIKDIELLYKEACRIAVEEGLFKVAWIGIINEETSLLEPVSQCGLNHEEARKLTDDFMEKGIPHGGIIEKVINSKNYVFADDVKEKTKNKPWHKKIIEYAINSCTVFPLRIEDKVIGVMVFYSEEYSFVEQEEINLLNNLCEDISFAIDTIKKDKIKKQVEEELIQSEERYRKIFELSPAAILVHSQFKILYANLAATELLGVEKKEGLIGKNLLDFVHKDYRHEVIKRKFELKEFGVPLPFEEQRYIRVDGTVIDVEATASLFPYKNQNAMVSVIRDITETKKLESLKKSSEENIKLLNEAREYDRLRTEFFANVSHELRTPINVILSAIQLLNLYIAEGNIIDEEGKVGKYIYSMQQNCYRLLRLVSNIIDITKIDAGFFELQLKNKNIVDVVEDITGSISGYTEHKRINLIFDTDTEEKILACDPDKIDRIMLNLLSNSIKFTNPGGTILVSVYDKKDKVVISVKDNGIGIPENKKNMVFERFQQVDKSLNRSHEGSGIGLSIVKSLVELHGGNIRVESEYGKGTEFIIELPVKLVTDSSNNADKTIAGESIEKINIEFSDIVQ